MEKSESEIEDLK